MRETWILSPNREEIFLYLYIKLIMELNWYGKINKTIPYYNI